MPQPFNSSWKKLERAKEHRNWLSQYVEETFAVESNRPRLGGKFDRKGGEYVIFVNHMPDYGDLFERVALIFGDALQNLRAALDHLAYELSRQHTGDRIEKPRSVAWPISDQADWTPAADSRIAEIDPRHWPTFDRYRGLQAIDERLVVGGSYFHPLILLRDLNDRDKHRLLTTILIPLNAFEVDQRTAAGTWAFQSFLYDWISDIGKARTAHQRPVRLGEELARVPIPTTQAHPQDMEFCGYVRPQLALPDGKPLIPVFDKIAGVVAQVIGGFEGEGNPPAAPGS